MNTDMAVEKPTCISISVILWLSEMKLSAIDRYQRNHDYLERNNHGSYHQGKEYLIQLIIRTHENISAHRGNDDDKQNADTGNTKGSS